MPKYYIESADFRTIQMGANATEAIKNALRSVREPVQLGLIITADQHGFLKNVDGEDQFNPDTMILLTSSVINQINEEISSA